MGWKAGTLTDAMCKKIEVFEKWTEKETNKAVLQRMSKQLEVLNTIKRRKLEYLLFNEK